MEVGDYQSAIAEVRIGKRVGTSIYFHESCVGQLPPTIAKVTIEAAQIAEQSSFGFNVFKLDTRTPLVSLLNYPGFFDEAFPTLLQSAICDRASNSLSVRDYARRDSRPVLHRKELLLPINHERVEEFALLTEVSEQVGLFADPFRIGRQGFWTSVLQDKHIHVIGHSLYRSDGCPVEMEEPDVNILRYRTALKRNRLSVPIQILYKTEMLTDGATLFDYGCGRGDDVRQLIDLGVRATGWDPHYSPSARKRPADVVNLGYVVNVIEDIEERRAVIKDAFSYAGNLLVVSALTGAPNYSGRAKPYKDGVLTSTGTFQRYYQQNELGELIRSSIDVDPIAVAPGVMYAFADEQTEQSFIAQRMTRRQSSRVRTTYNSVDELSDDAQRQAGEYWNLCLGLGRPAERDEADTCDELFKLVPSAKRLFDIVAKDKDASEFDAARRSRKEELLVHFAMSQFGKRLFFKYLPKELRRDIEFHFGKYTELTAASKQLLFSIADTEALLAACANAAEDGIGFLLDDHSLQLHISLLERLSPLLQVYVGCAGLLYGEWGQIDLVKVHIQSGKVSFMGYDDFEGRPVPDLLERIKVKMWEREVDYFDYIGQFTPTPLFLKSLFIDETFDYFEEQSAFDQALMRTKLFDFIRDNVPKDKFYSALENQGYRIEGYQLARAT